MYFHVMIVSGITKELDKRNLSSLCFVLASKTALGLKWNIWKPLVSLHLQVISLNFTSEQHLVSFLSPLLSDP